MTPYKKIFSTVFKAIISFSGLFYIFWKVPLKETMTHWSMNMVPWIVFILFLTFLSMGIQANRWRGLLLEDGKKVKFRTFYAYIALGYFFNNLLPGGFGGDAVKTISFGKRIGQTAQSVAAGAGCSCFKNHGFTCHVSLFFYSSSNCFISLFNS